MDVLDALHCCGQGAFEQIRDAPFHNLRQQAGVIPDHGGDGNRDVREDIGRHMEHRHGPEYHDEEGKHDEGVGPAQGNEDDLVHVRILRKGLSFVDTVCLKWISSPVEP